MKYFFLFLIIFTSSFCFADFDNQYSNNKDLDKKLQSIQEKIYEYHGKLSAKELISLHFDFDDSKIDSLDLECQKNEEDCYEKFKTMLKYL